jgi:Thiamine pyrophosphate enzyme, N-terminal TPP binding domain
VARKVADLLWEMLANAGVKRCYGIVGDALNPVIDALRRNGKIEFIRVRPEEYGVFAAVAACARSFAHRRELHPEHGETSMERRDGQRNQDNRKKCQADLNRVERERGI